jgi:hypothetical protein
MGEFLWAHRERPGSYADPIRELASAVGVCGYGFFRFAIEMGME